MTSNTTAQLKRVMITLAEHSADVHASHFVRSLRQLRPDIEISALGGDALKSAGVNVFFDTVRNAAMGWRGLLRAREMKQRLAFVAQLYATNKPDLHVCCDSWTMNVHFARLAKSFGVPVLYYIAPQAWASREGRVKELARVADQLACILPFEEAFFRERGVKATYVGHPLFDQPRHEILPGDPYRVALPCGSRRSIARSNFPRQFKVALDILHQRPATRFVIPTTDVTHDVVAQIVGGDSRFELIRNDFDRAVSGCGLAITVSGTATLHLAALGVPMIVVYQGSRFLWHAVGRWIIRTRTYAMVNLLAANGRDEPSRHIVQEFIPWYGSVKPVCDAALRLLESPELLKKQRAAIASIVEKVNASGASIHVAEMACELLDQRRS